MLLRLLGSLVSPSGSHARLSILIYHRVLPEPDPILPELIDAATFEKHVALLRTEFNVLPLGEACSLLSHGRLPARAVCITFDDGYSDNEEIAFPILKAYRLPATFFVSCGFLEGGAMFNDCVIDVVREASAGVHDLSSIKCGVVNLKGPASRRAAIDFLIEQIKYKKIQERKVLVEALSRQMKSPLPSNLMMRPSQVRHLHEAGMEIGGHTVNHPILATLEESEAREEIVRGKIQLEKIIEAPVKLFAYPNGKPGRDYGPREVSLVKDAGFVAAVSTTAGVADYSSDLYQLPRCGPWDRNPKKLGLRLLLGRWSSY